MISREIVWFNKNCIIFCDGKCEKAFGINNRPTNQLSKNEDDYEYLSDGELNLAPIDPKTYEGGHAKPIDRVHNKWCCRECERSIIVENGKRFILPNFDNRVKNIK